MSHPARDRGTPQAAESMETGSSQETGSSHDIRQTAGTLTVTAPTQGRGAPCPRLWAVRPWGDSRTPSPGTPRRADSPGAAPPCTRPRLAANSRAPHRLRRSLSATLFRRRHDRRPLRPKSSRWSTRPAIAPSRRTPDMNSRDTHREFSGAPGPVPPLNFPPVAPVHHGVSAACHDHPELPRHGRAIPMSSQNVK